MSNRQDRDWFARVVALLSMAVAAVGIGVNFYYDSIDKDATEKQIKTARNQIDLLEKQGPQPVVTAVVQRSGPGDRWVFLKPGDNITSKVAEKRAMWLTLKIKNEGRFQATLDSVSLVTTRPPAPAALWCSVRGEFTSCPLPRRIAAQGELSVYVDLRASRSVLTCDARAREGIAAELTFIGSPPIQVDSRSSIYYASDCEKQNPPSES